MNNVKVIFKEAKWRGPKAKKQVTNMYMIEVIKGNKNERSKNGQMVDQSNNHRKKGTEFHYIQPGVMGTLVGQGQGCHVLSIVSRLMEPQLLNEERTLT